MVSGPRQSYSCRAPCLPVRWPAPCHPVGERAGPRLEHNSRCAAFPPGRSSARGCIWSFYFRVWVGYSQCPNSRKRQHQKQSPIGKTRGRASDTERTDQHLRCSPSAPQTLPTISRVPFPNNPGEFQREGSPGGSRDRRLLTPQLQPPKEPRALLLSLPYVQVLPPERAHDKRRTRTPNTQQASTEPPPEGRASVVRTIWAARGALPSCLPSALLSKYI